jgi:diguanylate cyclase (GGDEF)-like protein/PAS domain S-box-containing protein
MKPTEGADTDPSPGEATPGAGASRLGEPFRDALAADADPQSVRMRRYYIAAGTSLLAIVVLLACAVEGSLPGGAFFLATIATLVAMVAFYFVFRSGLNLKATDPSLTVAQMLAATSVVLYAMYSADVAKSGVFVVLLVMVFLFGVLRLRTRALLLYALFLMAAHGAVILLRHWRKPEGEDLGVQLLQWVALAATLPWFALMGGYIRGLRAELKKSSARQQAAIESLKASESRLVDAQRIAGLGIWSFDLATKAATWSPETYRIMGLDPSGPVPAGEAVRRLIHEDDIEQWRAMMRQARDQQKGFDYRHRVLLPDGAIRWVHVVGEPVLDDSGNTTLLRGTVMDVTAAKEQEDALTLARDQAAGAQATLVDAIEGLTDCFALFDAEDHLLLCNGRYAEAFTPFKTFAEVRGMSFEDLVRSSVAKGEVVGPGFAGDVEGWIADRIRQHRNPGSKPRDLRLGAGRWLEITERRTRAGGIVAVCSDITERRHLEQRQAMEHAVARLLASAETIGEAMPRVIQTICETLGWDCGARWQMSKPEQVLRCVETWSVVDPAIMEFLAFGRKQSLKPSSSGLVRRVFVSGGPLWISDISREPGFVRAPMAIAAGLRGAFAFPIRVGMEIVGVMEFYIRSEMQPDPTLMRVLDSIGLQIGQFIVRKAAQEQLQRLAHYDFLTGLPNRNLFNELFVHSLAKAERNATRLAILFIDLDGFKQVNDTYGHDAGDHLLVTLTQRLRKCLRKSDAVSRAIVSDTAARLGGDEFVVLVDDVRDRAELIAVAQRVLEAAEKPFDLAGPQAHVTASIGISVFPEDGKDIDSLMKAADSAMYEAKALGRNTYRFYSTPADPRSSLQAL